MGDVAMIVPIIRMLIDQNPDIRVTIISRAFFKPIIDSIINVDFLAFDEKNRHKGFIGILRLFTDIQALKIDAFVDLHNVLRSKIIRKLLAVSGVKVAYSDKGRAGKKALTRDKNKIFKQLPTVFERHQKALTSLGFSLDLKNPIFPPKYKLTDELLNFIPKNIQNKNYNLIGVAPFAQYESKIYPLDLMQKVVDELASCETNIIFLFGGGATEIAHLNVLANNKKNIVNIAGKTTFAAQIKLISNLDIMLSMDSGNAHIAAMLGVKVITLWGATHPFAGFMPFNQPEANALLADRNLYPNIPTSIYGNIKVENYSDAMRTIPVETILAAIYKNVSFKNTLNPIEY